MSDTQNSTSQTPGQSPAPAQSTPKATPQKQSGINTGTDGVTDVAFKASAIGMRENAHNKDYFAEQNKKAQAKKQAQNAITQKSLIIGGVVAGVIVIVVVIWVIARVVSKTPEPEDSLPVATTEYSKLTETEKVETNQAAGQELYQSATDYNEMTGVSNDQEEVMKKFNEAIDSADTVVDNYVARIVAMQYLYAVGDYNQIIALGELADDNSGICGYTRLDLNSRLTCHNLMALAYREIGNEELENYHFDAMIPLNIKMEELGYGEEI